jgi:hypothetical protein
MLFAPKTRVKSISDSKLRKLGGKIPFSSIPQKRTKPRAISSTQRKRLKALKLIRDKWWAEGKRTCEICKKEILERAEYTLDHIEPGSAKSDAESNLQPAHWLCNHIKGSRRNFTRGEQ